MRREPKDLSDFVTFKVAKTPSCCGVILLHNLRIPLSVSASRQRGQKPKLPDGKTFKKRVHEATHQRPAAYFGDPSWKGRRDVVAQAITAGYQTTANKALRKAGFKEVGIAKNPNGSMLHFWLKRWKP